MANFCGGNFLSPQAGAFLLEQLGVTRSDYSQLKWAILIRAFCRLLPLGALWLVPDGVPTDSEFLERLKHLADPRSESSAGWTVVAESDVEAPSTATGGKANTVATSLQSASTTEQGTETGGE